MNPEKFPQPNQENGEKKAEQKPGQEKVARQAEGANELGWTAVEDKAERRQEDNGD